MKQFYKNTNPLQFAVLVYEYGVILFTEIWLKWCLPFSALRIKFLVYFFSLNVEYISGIPFQLSISSYRNLKCIPEKLSTPIGKGEFSNLWNPFRDILFLKSLLHHLRSYFLEDFGFGIAYMLQSLPHKTRWMLPIYSHQINPVNLIKCRKILHF